MHTRLTPTTPQCSTAAAHAATSMPQARSLPSQRRGRHKLCYTSRKAICIHIIKRLQSLKAVATLKVHPLKNEMTNNVWWPIRKRRSKGAQVGAKLLICSVREATSQNHHFLFQP
jgi:hypothetical protein